jgi:hypothetical protein
MIVKELDPLVTRDALAQAGHHAEAQLAHYLRRAFGEDLRLLVFHGLRLEREGDAAQIDHLLLHRHGMILIESKSVTTRVQVTEHEEWRRWWNGQWRGMPSPLRQVERQGEFLRGYLQLHKEALRDKVLWGLRQGGFRHMPLDRLVAISDAGIIERPKQFPLPAVCKADQIADRIRALVEQYRRANHWTSFDSHQGGYVFGDAELTRIRAFLLEQHRPLSVPPPQPDREPAPGPAAGSEDTPSGAATDTTAACLQCQSLHRAIQYGRYGYYFQCLACEATAGIQRLCPGCGQKARVRKQGGQFWEECARCGTSRCFHTNPEPVSAGRPISSPSHPMGKTAATGSLPERSG